MVGAMGRVPMPKELRLRFADKGTEMTPGQARSLHTQLKHWWVDRGTKAAPPPQKSGANYGIK